MNLKTIDTAIVSNAQIGSSAVEIFNAALPGDISKEVRIRVKLANRQGSNVVDFTIRGEIGGRLLFANTIKHHGTATNSMEIQSLPLTWEHGDVLRLTLESSDSTDMADIETLIEQSDPLGSEAPDNWVTDSSLETPPPTTAQIHDYLSDPSRVQVYHADTTDLAEKTDIPDADELAEKVSKKLVQGQPRIF